MELSTKIARQLEFYFGDANLRRDKFMQQQLKQHSDGFVPITVMLTFNRLKALTTEAEVVADAVANHSELLKLNEERNAIQRSTPFVDMDVPNDQVKACTAYLNRIPADATIESLSEYLSQFGQVSLVRIPKNKGDAQRSHRGFAFVEFTSPEAVAKLVAAIPRKPSQEASEQTPEGAVKTEDDSAAVKTEDDSAAVKTEDDSAAVKTEDDSAAVKTENESEGVQGEDEVKPKPMYALTLADWKEWSTSLRKAKKAAPAAPAPSKETNQHEVGRMVRVSGNLEGATKHDLQAIFSELGKIKYVDFYGDATFATLRFASAESAEQVVEKVAEGNVKFGENVLQAAVLSAEEQEKYWEKVHAATAARAFMPKNGRRQHSKNDKKRNREEQPAQSGEVGSPKKAKASEENVAGA